MNQKDLTHNVPLQYTGITNCMVFSDTVEVCQILITVFPHTLFSVVWASARVNRYFFHNICSTHKLYQYMNLRVLIILYANNLTKLNVTCKEIFTMIRDKITVMCNANMSIQ